MEYRILKGYPIVWVEYRFLWWWVKVGNYFRNDEQAILWIKKENHRWCMKHDKLYKESFIAGNMLWSNYEYYEY